MVVTAVASYVDSRRFFLSFYAVFSTKFNPKWAEITPKYPEVVAKGARIRFPPTCYFLFLFPLRVFSFLFLLSIVQAILTAVDRFWYCYLVASDTG